MHSFRRRFPAADSLWSSPCPSRSQMTWFACLLLIVSWVNSVACMSRETIESLRSETIEIFYHGYDNYLRYAFPEDELRPLTCGALTRDRENPAHVELNDVLGNYSLTLIDSLSTLAILASEPLPPTSKGGKRRAARGLGAFVANKRLQLKKEKSRKSLRDFQDGVALLVDQYGDGTEGPSGEGKRARGFDLDSKVQVFETVIRGVGGLLSAHLFAVGELPIRGYDPKDKLNISWPNGMVYDGQLLRLARDLGERLLPAFYTPTDLPYPRVNLRSGVPFYTNSPLNSDAEFGQCPPSKPVNAEITETCSAGAGSLVLEFSTLSRLIGDPIFETVAKQAFWAVWNRRSSVGLIGAGIDAETGEWVTAFTGIGAGIDSFFEYAFKSSILLSGVPYDETRPDLHSPESFLNVWQDAHAAIKRHVYRGEMFQHPHYLQSDLNNGALRAFWIDSLSAYYPGLLTLSGELEEAISTHLLYTALWTRYSALPERWSTVTGNVEAGLRWWGGRPEFIESTWYLYRATKDPWYLHVGEMALRDIKRRCWTKCGWAGLQDVRNGEKTDRMESFFLGETAKYLYLLFDHDHPLNSWDGRFVFTTEGHPLIIPKSTYNRTRKEESPLRLSTVYTNPKRRSTCPAPPELVPISISATAARGDVFHAASLARMHLMPTVKNLESPLVEFSSDHPSISLSDLRSPSNYTFFPWTLPLDLVPTYGTCSKMIIRLTFDLSFPNFQQTVVSSTSTQLQRIYDGIFIHSMSGVRLGLVKEPLHHSDSALGDIFRIYSVSNVALGRDEKVFLDRQTVSTFNPTDPYFTRIRDIEVVDLVVDVATPPVNHTSVATPEEETQSPADAMSPVTLNLNSLGIPDENDPSLLSSLLQNIQSLLLDALPSHNSPKPSPPPPLTRNILNAALPTGPGAAPLPSLDDEPEELHSSTTNIDDANSPLDWGSIYFAPDNLCDNVLPPHIPREYQVVVVRRGGCSFSTKMRNIPSYAPSRTSLQLVLIVSFPENEVKRPPTDSPEGEEEEEQRQQSAPKEPPATTTTTTTPPPPASYDALVQPYLDCQQVSPAGVLRAHPIPMVMVTGGDQTMHVLRNAKGISVRRRWWIETQGVRIGNLIIV